MFLELAEKTTRLLVSFASLGEWRDSVGQFDGKWKQALVLLALPSSARPLWSRCVCVVLTLVSDAERSASC